MHVKPGLRIFCACLVEYVTPDIPSSRTKYHLIILNCLLASCSLCRVFTLTFILTKFFIYYIFKKILKIILSKNISRLF